MKKDSPPPPSGVHIWLIVIKAFRALSAATAAGLESCGLGESDFRVLEALLHKDALPVNALGAIVGLTPGSISTAVDRLFKKRLVTRVASRADRRVHTVDLTPAGRTLITQVFAAHAQRMEEIAAVLTPLERTQLTQALKKMGKRAASHGHVN